jgi:hypothetical protein
MPVLELKSVSKSYGRNRSRVQVLRDISLTVEGVLRRGQDDAHVDHRGVACTG